MGCLLFAKLEVIMFDGMLILVKLVVFFFVVLGATSIC
jgi:hypothetical protein